MRLHEEAVCVKRNLQESADLFVIRMATTSKEKILSVWVKSSAWRSQAFKQCCGQRPDLKNIHVWGSTTAARGTACGKGM
jgi:hypothetical protein